MIKINTVLTLILLLEMAFCWGCKKPQVGDKDSVVYRTDTIKDRNNMKSITIGTQEWMTENLNVLQYRNGDSIPEVRDFNEWDRIKTGAWCYYHNDPENGKIYGKLYNWYAVNDPRGLAPQVWHIPSIAEWMTLTYYLGGKEEAGGKLKKDTTLWKNPNNGVTNESGFSALPGGIREPRRGFSFLNERGYYWSSEVLFDDIRPLNFYLGYDYSNICRSKNDNNYGMSIRCIKDYQDGKDKLESKKNNDYTKHSNFKMFWKDFKKAVLKGNKNAVLKMTNIPFIDSNRDIYDEAYGSSRSLTSLSEEEFLDNYDKIFDISSIKIIETAKFKIWGERVNDGYATNGPGLYKWDNEEKYMLQLDNIEPNRIMFERISGVYKLTNIPYQE